MISLERWTQLLADTPGVLPSDDEQYQRLKKLEPRPTAMAWAVRQAFGADPVRPWWAA